jgi:hypothetical protein
MRRLLDRLSDGAPPRGALVIIVIGVLGCLASGVLARDPGAVGNDVTFNSEAPLRDSAPVALGPGGRAQLVSGYVSSTDPNDLGDRLFKVEISLNAAAGAGYRVAAIRCVAEGPRGTHIPHAEGRRAAYPPPTDDASIHAIREGASVEFPNGDAELAGVQLRNHFFHYVLGGKPSVEWPGLAERHQAWIWKYPKPVPKTRINWAVMWTATGGQKITLRCTPQATGPAGGTASATVTTAAPLR